MSKRYFHLASLVCLALYSMSFAPVQAQSSTELAVGAGLIAVVPFGHVEARHYFSDRVSLTAFASTTKITGSIKAQTESQFALGFANLGTELRYHIAPQAAIDPHVGLGSGFLITSSESNKVAVPWAWINMGVTVPLGSHAKLDFEVNPVLGLSNESESGIIAIPVARLRWVL